MNTHDRSHPEQYDGAVVKLGRGMRTRQSGTDVRRPVSPEGSGENEPELLRRRHRESVTIQPEEVAPKRRPLRGMRPPGEGKRTRQSGTGVRRPVSPEGSGENEPELLRRRHRKSVTIQPEDVDPDEPTDRHGRPLDMRAADNLEAIARSQSAGMSKKRKEADDLEAIARSLSAGMSKKRKEELKGKHFPKAPTKH